MGYPYMEPMPVVAVVTDHDFGLVEGIDKDYIIFRAPKPGQVFDAWTAVDSANMGGTLKVSLRNRGVAGTATAAAIFTHATTALWATGSPNVETVTAVQLAEDDFLDVKLECEATTNTVTVNRLTVGFKFIPGGPVAEGK